MLKPLEISVGEITHKAGEYASFYSTNADDLLKVRRALLQDWCEKNSFSEENYKHFKAGLATMILFFESCLETVEDSTKDSNV